MVNLKVGEKTYNIKFGYRALAKSNVLATVIDIQKEMNDISRIQEEREKEKENRKNFPEHYVDEMGNPIEDNDENDTLENFSIYEKMIVAVEPLLLAGLQKKHPEFKVDYDNPEDIKAKREMVIDLIDDYTDEEDSMDIADLFTALVEELFDSGFLSQKSKKLETAMEQTDSTVVPTDHLQPKN